VLTDANASVLVGGGSHSNVVYFGVYTADGTEITRVARSSNSELFEAVSLDLTSYVGETIYWQIVDNSTSGWGFITVDDIQFNRSEEVTLTAQDIGSVATDGSYTVSEGTHTVRASGSDIWNTSDEFQFASTSLSGDGEVVVLAESVSNTHRWAKAGIMMRSGFNAGSQNVFVFVAPDGRATMQVRSSNNGRSSNITAGNAVGSTGTPKFLSLQRTGDTFTGSYSEDGQTWIEISSVNVTMAEEVLTGLAVTSHNDGTLTTASFSSLIIEEQ